jgi:hypothetical protein
MDKFAHEKNRKKDLVIIRGADPLSSGIRRNDEYLAGEKQFHISAQRLQSDKSQPRAKSREEKTANKINESDGEDILVGVSEDLLNIFFSLATAHPDTRLVDQTTDEDGSINVSFSNRKGFVLELQKAVASLDARRKRLSVKG